MQDHSAGPPGAHKRRMFGNLSRKILTIFSVNEEEEEDGDGASPTRAPSTAARARNALARKSKSFVRRIRKSFARERPPEKTAPTYIDPAPEDPLNLGIGKVVNKTGGVLIEPEFAYSMASRTNSHRVSHNGVKRTPSGVPRKTQLNAVAGITHEGSGNFRVPSSTGAAPSSQQPTIMSVVSVQSVHADLSPDEAAPAPVSGKKSALKNRVEPTYIDNEALARQARCSTPVSNPSPSPTPAGGRTTPVKPPPKKPASGGCWCFADPMPMASDDSVRAFLR